ncbi:MAG: hypothetical protein DMG88_18995 [Acidobacteria bacterium]|nr:MAG: hypothetical protein DMG88_18995 [Acidobacteriota bacterium]
MSVLRFRFLILEISCQFSGSGVQFQKFFSNVPNSCSFLHYTLARSRGISGKPLSCGIFEPELYLMRPNGNLI